MRNKEYKTFIIGLGMVMLMSTAIVGCGKTNQPVDEVVSTEAQTEVQEEGYVITDVQVPYTALVKKDTSIYSTEDAKTIIVDIAKDSYVTVTGTVQFNGVDVDYYNVKTDDGVEGFMEGKYLDFNVQTDALANVEEVEGGDGEETTEGVTESSEVAENTDTSSSNGASEAPAFEQYQMFTNTNCNVRSQPSKEGTLLGTMTINTEITVTGIDGDWSQLSYDGSVAYIKSSLLSTTQTEVKQSSTSKPADTSSSNGGTTSSSQAGSTQPQASNDLSALLNEGRGSVSVDTNTNNVGDGNATGDYSNVIMH